MYFIQQNDFVKLLVFIVFPNRIWSKYIGAFCLLSPVTRWEGMIYEYNKSISWGGSQVYVGKELIVRKGDKIIKAAVLDDEH